jgi:hypothetical protein
MTKNRKESIQAILGVILLIVLSGYFIWFCMTHPFTSPKPTLKYKVGDVVYLKPDSLKVVVIGALPNLQDYHVEYTDNFGKRQLEIVRPSSVY